jgi:hypothetical protein
MGIAAQQLVERNRGVTKVVIERIAEVLAQRGAGR